MAEAVVGADEPKSAVCLVIDWLGVGFLGPYGNCWVATPAMDRLAAESTVFDQCLVEGPNLEDFYRACWQGLHPWTQAAPARSLATLLDEASVPAVLLTDDPQVAALRLAENFHQVITLPAPAAEKPAENPDETHFAEAFGRLFACLEQLRPPLLVWCHLGALGRCWDAPLSLREQYREEGDPEPYPGTSVPTLLADKPLQLDELLPIMQAYAGQVSVLDACIGALCEALAELPCGPSVLLAMLSPRGMPLGEHGCIGPTGDALYSERVHVPLLLRFADGTGMTVRCGRLVQPGDLFTTLCQWWHLPLPDSIGPYSSLLPLVQEEDVCWRDRVVVVGDAQQAIRTPAWYLRQYGEQQQMELFVKPDDRWDQNDVADRCPELVETLTGLLTEYRAWITAGQRGQLSPLEEILVSGPE